MKKNLSLLTGIVFIITILAADACRGGEKQNVPKIFGNDKTEVIYLKDTLIDGRMHLEMYNEKRPDHKVIDHLVTDVNREYTVKFKHADGSRIQKVLNMRPADGYANIFMEVDSSDGDLFELKINDNAPDDIIVKYEILFTVKRIKETTWSIDPFLRIPPSP